MFISENIIICLLFLSPFFSFTILRSAIIHIFQLGKSKSRIKKITKGKRMVERLLLLGYVETCDFCLAQATWIRRAYWTSLLFQAFAVVGWLASFVYTNILIAVQYLLLIRSVTLDLPAFILLFVMTTHGKHGGVTWKWDM